MACQFLRTKLKCVTVEPILFLYMMVIFLETNALQELIAVKSCLKIMDPVNITDCNNKTFRQDSIIVDEKTYWIRFSSAFLFFSTFLSSFFVASWSDKFGRKLPMLIPPIGTMIAASVNCVASIYIHSHIAYLFISSTVSGLTFGTVGIVAATFGFVTDISDESTRTKRMMILEAMIYIGGFVGIYIAGVFLKNVDYSLTLNGFSQLFIFEISVALVITLYTIFRIPSQSNDTTEASQISCSSLFTLGHVKNAVKTVVRAREAGKRKVVLLLSSALFLIYFGLVVQFTLAYYLLNDKLGWEFPDYTVFNSVQFAVEGLALLLGMPVLFHLLHVQDHLICALGIVSKMAGYFAFGLSNSNLLIYSCIPLYMFSEYAVPPIRSMLSKTVDEDEKGRIFAFTTILQNFCFLIGSVTFTTVYKSTFMIFPGLCFVIAATLQFFALLIIIHLYFTRGEVITTYEIMENEDGTVDETCHVERSSGSIN